MPEFSVPKKSPAIFLDRDGTLMRDVDYCGNPQDVAIFKDAPAALRKLKDRGYKLIIITNQSGIGRKYFTEKQYRAVEMELARQLGQDLIDATYFCPHLPDAGCKCRKPSPELIFQAAHDHDIDLAASFFIGDKISDLECGRNAGVKTVLVQTGYGQETDPASGDYIASDLNIAADQIVEATQ
jgi:D,D-heptose 1,7-bisphosphate phosphatase